MRKVKILATDEIKYVDNNTAFSLIDSGKAVLAMEDKQLLVDSDKVTKRYRTK